MGTTRETFKGFPSEAIAFLSQLARNNNKGWFDAHRATYDAAIVAPALAFVESMGAAIRTFAPSVVPEPRIGGSLFRIHRDTRFSNDKRPYKTHVGIRLRDGDTARASSCTGPLFYVEFDASRLRLGVGVKEFDTRTLEAYRRAVARRKDATALGNMIHRAEAQGHHVLGEMLTRAPAAYTHQADDELLRRRGLFVCEERTLPREIHGPEFTLYCKRWFAAYAPLFHGLRRIAIAGLD
ncbi:MAG TPA: DUF2461 domain-containing protein [Gemmatimonadaceae bacterium]|nr:MAG: hypothetical protein A3D33_18480 [Candidatus Rokubacteria bacterium RIFCSPHIGHO2_02_FULL_73_26]HLA91010.1 DUF2461 domain-containing protein [Gemmatimonadaceae bacterium]